MELIRLDSGQNGDDFIKFVFNGSPSPAMRARVCQGGKRRFTPEPYASYKEALSLALRAQYPSVKWGYPDLPETKWPASKRPPFDKWLKKQRFALAYYIYRAADRGDIDNYQKCIQDCIEQSGLIPNDKQITSVYGTMLIDKERPRIEVTLVRNP